MEKCNEKKTKSEETCMHAQPPLIDVAMCITI